jgi:hypothetical protein
MTAIVAVVVGYDNKLTKQDRDIIKNARKNMLYEFHLLYYIPKIPAECFLVKEMVAIEQQYRNQARQTLNFLSKELNIPLIKKNDAIDYTNLIQPGPAAIFYTIKHLKNINVVITSHPDKLNPDLWDRFVNWLKVQKSTQWLLRHLSYSSASITKSTPIQFIGIATKAKKKGIHTKSEGHRIRQSQQITSTFKDQPKKESNITHEKSKLFESLNRTPMTINSEEEVEICGNRLRVT